MSKNNLLPQHLILQENDQIKPILLEHQYSPVAVATTRGPLYEKEQRDNQDCIAIAQAKLEDGTPLLVDLVCDGLGGYPKGGKASYAFAEALLESTEQSLKSPQELLERVLEKAAKKYQQIQLHQPSGTTFVIAVTSPKSIVISSLGDSKAFLLSSQGELLAESQEHKPAGFSDRFRLTRYFYSGNSSTHLKDVSSLSWDRKHIREDAVLLLCSDGVTDNMISSKEDRNPLPQLQRLMKKSIDPSELCAAIMQAAHKRMKMAGTSSAQQLDVKPDNMACLVRLFKH